LAENQARKLSSGSQEEQASEDSEHNNEVKESDSTTEASACQYNFFDPPIEIHRRVYSPSQNLEVRRRF